LSTISAGKKSLSPKTTRVIIGITEIFTVFLRAFYALVKKFAVNRRFAARQYADDDFRKMIYIAVSDEPSVVSDDLSNASLRVFTVDFRNFVGINPRMAQEPFFLCLLSM
jgi:hypothetical protein